LGRGKIIEDREVDQWAGEVGSKMQSDESRANKRLGFSGNVIRMTPQGAVVTHSTLIREGNYVVVRVSNNGEVEVAEVSKIESIGIHPSMNDGRVTAVCTIDNLHLMPDHPVALKCAQHNGGHVEAWLPANSPKNPLNVVNTTSNQFHIAPTMTTLRLLPVSSEVCYPLAGSCVPARTLDRIVAITEPNPNDPSGITCPLDLSRISIGTHQMRWPE
jgi:hypothetical protein